MKVLQILKTMSECQFLNILKQAASHEQNFQLFFNRSTKDMKVLSTAVNVNAMNVKLAANQSNNQSQRTSMSRDKQHCKPGRAHFQRQVRWSGWSMVMVRAVGK